MFNEFFSFLNCCSRRKDSGNNSSEEEKENLSPNKTTHKKEEILDIIEIDNIVELQHLIKENNNEASDSLSTLEDKNSIDIQLNEEHKVERIKYSKLKIFFQQESVELLKGELDTLLFSDKLIRPEEKEKINFTPRGVVDFSEYLLNLDEYTQFYDKNDLTLSYRKSGTNITSDFMLGRCEYKLKKSIFKEGVDLKLIWDTMYKPELRLKWDTTVKSTKILEGDETSYVHHTHLHSPVFFISERDTVEKRVELKINELYYSLSTSVNDDYLPCDSKVVRCKTYINLYIFSQDLEYYYFLSFNQIDIKMNIPDSFMNMMLPFKISNFYEILIEEVNKNFN